MREFTCAAGLRPDSGNLPHIGAAHCYGLYCLVRPKKTCSTSFLGDEHLPRQLTCA